MPEHEGYIWIQNAVEEYHRSRTWLDIQLREGRLTYAKFEGDRHIYLLRSELDAIVGKPTEQGRRSKENAG